MTMPGLSGLEHQMRAIRAARSMALVAEVGGGLLQVRGFGSRAMAGDQVTIFASSGERLGGEVISLSGGSSAILPDKPLTGVAVGDEVMLDGPLSIAPCADWIGRVIDASGAPLDGRFLPRGAQTRGLEQAAPNPARRRALGARLESGMSVFNTLLPLVRGQRLGLFSGSGVGKSSLLAHFAAHMQADVIVMALIGERGRELRHFVEIVLGPEGMARTVIIAATSDQSPLMRKRCALTAMSVAEHFRDAGKHVLLLADSVTRFAEAHREIAVASGEPASLRGYPASLAHQIMSLCERAGPGEDGQGDITAIFSVLVAGSDMEEPVADLMRGVLDGHVVLDRAIAERGRYPAIDAVRSISRSLPDAASPRENDLISIARRLIGTYEENAMMIRAGLYAEGNDSGLDIAVKAQGELDRFVGAREHIDSGNSFKRLELILRKAGALDQQALV